MHRLSRVLILIACCALLICAEEAPLPTPLHSDGAWMAVAGSLGGLLLGIVQLIVGLGIAAFAITKGLQVVSRLLGGLDIWAEIAKKNIAVALLAAGAVISYTNVIGSGIYSMTDSLNVLVQGNLWDGIVGMIAGVINLIVAIMVASFAITVTFKIMDAMTKGIDEKAELSGNNIAIGVLYCGILIGVSFLVSNGVTGIGKGLGMFLSATAKAIGL